MKNTFECQVKWFPIWGFIDDLKPFHSGSKPKRFMFDIHHAIRIYENSGREPTSCCPSTRTCGYLSGKSLFGWLGKTGRKSEKVKRYPGNLEWILIWRTWGKDHLFEVTRVLSVSWISDTTGIIDDGHVVWPSHWRIDAVGLLRWDTLQQICDD